MSLNGTLLEDNSEGQWKNGDKEMVVVEVEEGSRLLHGRICCGGGGGGDDDSGRVHREMMNDD